MHLRRIPLLLLLPVLSLVGCSSSAAPEESAAEEAFTMRSCIIERPIEADGYREILEADPAKVTRQRLGPDGTLIPDPERVVRPSAANLDGAMRKISAHVDRINREVPDSVRRREVYSPSLRGQKPEPYCLFHKAGDAVYGTVVLFHGFNDRPHQQAKLASYLFHRGFNVYNTFLANMYMVEGTDFWPKVVYRPEVLATVQRKFAVPENQAAVQPILPRLQTGALTPTDIATIDRILAPELSTTALQAAWRTPGSDDFARFFMTHEPTRGETLVDAARHSDFMDYVREATARIDDLADLPGPIFVGGLSVGGTVALAAAAADGGRRVRSVVAHAPWFQSLEPRNNLQLMLAGPLDDKLSVVSGAYPIRWENHNIAFSPASVAASLALGSWTARPENLATLARIPTALVLTDADDSADNQTSTLVHGALTSDARVAALHARVTYPASFHVGHAMTDPENYRDLPPDTAGWNHYWRTLYQESFRFYTQGAVSETNLRTRNEDGTLPTTGCSMPDHTNRCSE